MTDLNKVPAFEPQRKMGEKANVECYFCHTPIWAPLEWDYCHGFPWFNHNQAGGLESVTVITSATITKGFEKASTCQECYKSEHEVKND